MHFEMRSQYCVWDMLLSTVLEAASRWTLRISPYLNSDGAGGSPVLT